MQVIAEMREHRSRLTDDVQKRHLDDSPLNYTRKAVSIRSTFPTGSLVKSMLSTRSDS